MRLLPRLTATLVLALGGVMASADSASAAWNNVFQVCCNDCNKPRTSYAAPACPQACPQPQVQVNYIQRTYYQPVTEYVRQSYYEPVKQNYTSYYYEPVTEYRYSTYYDPCTGCPQRVCTPTTAYKLRSKCNSVTSYVERTAMVPVTSLKPVTMRQPVVTYYYPPEQACPPASTSGAAPFIPPSGPSVDELRSQPPSVMPSTPGSDGGIPPTTLPTQPGAFPRTAPPTNTPNFKIRPDKTTGRSSVVTVRGEVVQPDQLTPRASAKLVFVNAAQMDQKEYATANEFGEFDVRLPAGTWYLYLGGNDGKAVFHKQVTVGSKDTYDYRVVSR